MYFIILFFNIIIHLLISFLLIFIFGSYTFFLISQISFFTFFNVFIPFCTLSFLLSSFFTKNPINTLLLILLSFILSSFLLFQIANELLTYTFLIVYIGALMMLFLFVIMLFNLQKLSNNKKINKFILSIFLFFFLCIIFNFFSFNFYTLSNWNNIINTYNTSFSTIFFFATVTTNGIKSLEILYTEENIFFIFLTLLLLFTMLGAITLANATKKKI